MPFSIKQGDITRFQVDAVVNAANSSLLGGGGVDGAIHRAAGPELRAYCAGLGGCKTGEAKLSPGFGLPARWIIHTVGPIWRGGGYNEEALLSACYRNSLKLALEQGLHSVAFPLISAGAYGYPRDQALAVAVREIKAFLTEQEMEVSLVIYDPASFRLSGSLFSELRSYLNRFLPEADARPDSLAQRKQAMLSSASYPSAYAAPAASASDSVKPRPVLSQPAAPKKLFKKKPRLFSKSEDSEDALPECFAAESPFFGTAESLDQRLRCLDESFSQMLLRKIDEKGLSDAACYKRANVDRKLFSKIRSDPNYRPSKPTAIAFAISLELSLPETRELLMKAGFALSHSSKFDVIIEYFISNGRYDIFEINEALFAFDQNLLGA